MAPEADGVVRRPEGATSAFLLLHGFAAAPDEVETLGTYLEENGIASLAVRIAGHDTSPEDLAVTTWRDWHESAKIGLAEMQTWNMDFAFIAGFSMGGLLSLLLSSSANGIDGLVTICPAISVPSKLGILLPVLKRIKKYRGVDLGIIAQTYDVSRTKYSREPLSAYHEFFKLMKETRKQLNQVTIPTLVIQAGSDKTIDPASGKIVYDGISSQNKELHIIEGAEHVIPCHPSREVAYPLIQKFAKEISES